MVLPSQAEALQDIIKILQQILDDYTASGTLLSPDIAEETSRYIQRVQFFLEGQPNDSDLATHKTKLLSALAKLKDTLVTIPMIEEED